MRAPYILYKRKSGKRTPSYYVAFWSEAHGAYRDRVSVARIIEALGARGRNLSATSRAGADMAVQSWLEAGAPSRIGDTWWSYLEGFWGRDGEYAGMLRDAGRSISNAYADDNEDVLSKYVYTYLETHGRLAITLTQVDTDFIETMLRSFQRDHGLSGRRLNQIRQAIGVAMKEAKRRGKIARNPVTDVIKFREQKSRREIFTRPEAARFFGTIANADRRVSTIHLLAATTGMRLGECLGLTIDRLHAEIVDGVTYTWVRLDDESSNWTESDRHHGVKSGSVGDVPLPDRTAEAVRALYETNPWPGSLWVFFSTKPERPMTKREVAASFNAACREIGIDDKERKRRGLGFHAWRHWYVSVMRGLSDAKSVQEVVRHKNASTTAIYSHLTDEQRREIASVAGGLIE